MWSRRRSNATVYRFGVSWAGTAIGKFGWNTPNAAYPTAPGFGDDPKIPGASFFVFLMHLPNDGTGWKNPSLQRLPLSCQLPPRVKNRRDGYLKYYLFEMISG